MTGAEPPSSPSRGGSTASRWPTTCAPSGWELPLLSFDYGQRHVRELEFARRSPPTARRAAPRRRPASAGALLSGSALTDDAVDVPDGHYTDESMKATVVPNRNAIFAVGGRRRWPSPTGPSAVGLRRPRRRPPDLPRLPARVRPRRSRPGPGGNEGFGPRGSGCVAPFLHLVKADIVRRGRGARRAVRRDLVVLPGR